MRLSVTLDDDLREIHISSGVETSAEYHASTPAERAMLTKIRRAVWEALDIQLTETPDGLIATVNRPASE